MEQFTAGKEIPAEMLPPHVYSSWRECRDSGLVPSDIPEIRRLSLPELQALKREYRHLLDTAEPVLKMIQISTSETKPIVILTLANGVILHIAGDERSLSPQERFFNAPGVLFDEKLAGTRATIMALKERRPLSLCGCEHYLEMFHESLCYAAPIFGDQENIVASISIASSLKKYHPHTMAMLTAAAENIGIQLHKISWDNKTSYLNSLVYSICDTLPEGLVALDRAHNITYVNEAAASLLCGCRETLVARPISEFIHTDSAQELMRSLDESKRGRLSIHLAGHSTENKFLCHIQPLKDPENGLIGATLFLASDKRVLKGMHHMGYNRAHYRFDDILGESPQIKRSINLARKIARQANRILVTGESGTGKELFAQALHNAGPRRSGPFVAISCASIPRELVEAELFGYVPGAFTGASKDGAMGKFELAQKGTIFLDEINSLPMEAQGKLLRALQQNEIVRVGGVIPVRFDATVISASNVSLPELVESKMFRQDLLYRINGVEIQIPPLRERDGDAEILMTYFIGKLSKSQGRKITMSKQWKEAMLDHAWVGNIRELENACEYSTIICENGILKPKHLHPAVGMDEGGGSSTNDMPASGGSMEDVYRGYVVSTMEKYGGNISKAAKHLGISRNTLYRRLKRAVNIIDQPSRRNSE